MSGEPTARDDRAHWTARYAERGMEPDRVPSPWVIRVCLALPADAVFLDVAGGAGRHAGPLAGAGRTVIVLDFITAALEAARQRHPSVLAVAADARSLPVRPASVDAVVCVNFLDRAAVAAMTTALRSGGALVYETFTRRHLALVEAGRARGPRNPCFLLAPGELRTLVRPLAIREYSEALVSDEVGERHVARVVAVKA
jgi:SAM-dependent methyltransferase